MKEYLICSAFWCVFTLILCAFGKAVKRDSKNISESLIWGYIVYSMLIAVVGVPMQVLNLPWLAFGVYVGMLWGGIIAYIIYAVKYNIGNTCCYDAILLCGILAWKSSG